MHSVYWNYILLNIFSQVVVRSAATSLGRVARRLHLQPRRLHSALHRALNCRGALPVAGPSGALRIHPSRLVCRALVGSHLLMVGTSQTAHTAAGVMKARLS